MSYILLNWRSIREKSYCTGRLILLEHSYQKLLKGNKKVMDTKKPPILVSNWECFCPGGKRIVTQKKIDSWQTNQPCLEVHAKNL